MNRLVYLFELDSVRNSAEEVELGQHMLYNELVKNGNIVVLSFNQWVDSIAFSVAFQDDNAYECIKKLVSAGAIKVSQFGDNRTASQFVQNSIIKCLASNSDSFIFSGIELETREEKANKDKEPAKKRLKIILRSLIDSDPAYLEKEKEAFVGLEDHFKQIVRFVEITLALSMDKSALNPPRAVPKSEQFLATLEDLLTKLPSDEYTAKYKNLQVRALIGDAASILRGIWKKKEKENEEGKKALNVKDQTKALYYAELVEEFLQIKDSNNSYNLPESVLTALDEIQTQLKTEQTNTLYNRSVWYNEMKLGDITDAERLACAIIDLCYNFTNENSILGISKHYHSLRDESFYDDFIFRLEELWENWRDRLLCDEKVSVGEISSVIKLPDWEAAAHIAADEERVADTSVSSLYESDIEGERKKWKKKVYADRRKAVFSAVIYIVAFIVIELLVDFLFGSVTALFGSIIPEGITANLAVVPGWVTSIMSTVASIAALGLLNSFMTNGLNKMLSKSENGFLSSLELVDIAECFTIFKTCRRELKAYKKAGIAYENPMRKGELK